MASVAARDARTVVLVRAALKALVALGDEGASAWTIFGAENQKPWTRKLMQRLESKGLIRSFVGPRQSKTGPPHVTWYAALDGLDDATNEDEAVSALLWPSGHDAGQRRTEPPEAGEEEPEDDEPDEEPEVSPAVSIAGTDRELLEASVKLTAALLESLGSLHGKLDALATEVAALKQAWS